MPAFASLPILVAYTGLTSVVVPIPLIPYLGNYVELGMFYYMYMLMVAIFCTNAINIYAGVNGIEVGQSLVIACSILLHNLLEIYLTVNPKTFEHHLFSIIIILPFIFTTFALYQFNKYPSTVFVGDTFCYWAGMVLAVAGILGHFSKTLMLFFIP